MHRYFARRAQCQVAHTHLCSVSVPSTGGLLVIVLEVGSGEEVAEDELGDVAVVLLVEHDGDALSVVLDRNGVAGAVDSDVEPVHRGVALLVVGGVHCVCVLMLFFGSW